ncbi:MAG: hypothetical protein QOH86_1702, partial [Sphingomonadales bacterium]|nr:hypothetical protein [Sphingomonadales bacterium]
MNWFDRVVAAVAPRAGLRRAQARRALRFIDNVERRPDFDRNTGRVADALPVRAASRSRIRNLIATNPYARKALNTLINNLIGFGITGTPKKGTPKKVATEWKRWTARGDWLGRLDFNGLQEQFVSAMLGDGECFIVRRFEAGGGIVPLRIELLDQVMLAEWKGRDGIEYDERGRATRFWFRKSRDPETGAASNEAVDFPAADVIHLYRSDWIGQGRGRSMFEPVMKRLEDLDGYFEAETVRKQIEACFAAFIQPSLDSDEAFGPKDGTTGATGFDVETLEPGMLTRLRPGETVSFGTPRVTSGISEFARVSLLATTAGAGIPYEQGTGDLSNVNYSSYKAGSLEFQRFCGRLQWLLIIPVALERIWGWFLDDGFKV